MNPISAHAPHRYIPHYSRLLLISLKTPLLIYFAVMGNLLTFGSAYAFWKIEGPINPNVNSFFDAIWWAMVTVTTVGYGDIVPLSFAGKLLGLFLIIFGISFFLSFAAVLVSAMIALVKEQRLKTYDRYGELIQEIKQLREQIQEIKQQKS